MPGGGAVTIETSNVALGESLASPELGIEPGPYVLLSVTDTGAGMDPETLSHVFEPFFTTKELGRGTGLGLATVFGIVKQSGGHIYAESEPGQGSVFKIYLPRAEGKAAPKREGEAVPAAAGGGEAVLVVEDDGSVRKLACQILTKSGYVVLEASDPVAGLDLVRTHAGHIDLLVSDVVMPQMSGPVFAKQVALLRPEIKVLFLSGYAGRAVTEQGGLDPSAPFLQKPFSPEDLLKKTREVLASTTV
jgi:CheY-like chemotaxis protein